MLSVSLAMKRFLAVVLLVALPLGSLAAVISHALPGEMGHAAPATMVHGDQQDDAGDVHSALLPHDDDSASCCVLAGFCHGTPGLTDWLCSPLRDGSATDRVLIAPHCFTSFASESPERPPL